MVEWKKLGEVCEVLDSQRKPISKDKRISGIYPYYGANGIQDYVDGYIFDGTYLLVGEDGSGINKDNSPVLHWVSGQFWVNNHAHILSETNNTANLRYLYYILQTIDVSDIVRGVPPKLNQANLKNISIPLPSPSEQSRIVSILDTFTASIANLKEQIGERRKQYEHYRNQLLQLEGKEGVEMKTLGEVCEIRNGYTPSTKNPDFWDNGEIPWFTLEDIRKNGSILYDAIKHITPLGVKRNGLFPKKSIIVSTTATIGEYALICADFMCNQQLTCISINDNYTNLVQVKYLYHLGYKIGEWCRNNVNGGGGLSIVSTSKLKQYLIPIPSLPEQSRIVSILDQFEASIANLEAQLQEREKQSEHYRNQLLTFE